MACVCLPFVSSAQTSTSTQEPEGLPAPATRVHNQGAQISEYAREVFQDREGNPWFGTNGDGVCRYDGTSLTYLSVEEGLAGRAVRGILQDEAGALWFATDGGCN